MRHLALLLLLLTSCGVVPGLSPERSRDMITLGTVDLSRGGTHQFKIGQLRNGDIYVLGLYQVAGSCDLQGSQQRIDLLVVNEMGLDVVKANTTLSGMRWSKGRDECLPAFGYLRGEGRSTPISGTKDVCNEPLYSGADRGHGTQFVAQRANHQYTISVKVSGAPSTSASSAPAYVVLANDGPDYDKKCQ